MKTFTQEIEAIRSSGWRHKKEETRLLILEVMELPTLSFVMNKVMTVATNDRFGAMDMAEVISRDPSLSRNVLKIVNSVYFDPSLKVPTVSRATSDLGPETVKSIALSASVIEALRGKTTTDGFDRTKFWAHSLGCAYIAKKIATMSSAVETEPAFVSGLMHDIGKIVLDLYFPNSYRLVRANLATSDISSLQAEYDLLGFTHPEVGLWLAQRWKFPRSVSLAIANHHGPVSNDTNYQPLTAAVRLADYLCILEGMSLKDNALVKPLDDAITDCLKLERKDLAEIRRALNERREALNSLFSS